MDFCIAAIAVWYLFNHFCSGDKRDQQDREYPPLRAHGDDCDDRDDTYTDAADRCVCACVRVCVCVCMCP